MENASKALIIAGAILLSILIIAIGMFIYTSSQSTINESMIQMSTQEIEAFNSQFTIYEGDQSGSKVKSMISKLIANANTYKEELAKMPAVGIDHYTDSTEDNALPKNAKVEATTEVADYISSLGTIRGNLDNKHPYYVKFTYNQNGIISGIMIKYNKANNDFTPGED